MKYVFVPNHLSTGGMPQYLLFFIKKLLKEHNYEVFVVEFSNISDEYVIQKNKIKKIVDNNHFYTLQGDDYSKHINLVKIFNEINPDIVHLQEVPEAWCPVDTADYLYREDRSYKIIETSHDSQFSVDRKIYHPDKYIFIGESHRDTYLNAGFLSDTSYEIIKYEVEKKERPIRDVAIKKLGLDPNKHHVLNVGLFTPNKNQGEVMRIANLLKDHPIQFHFVGNTAPNFKKYWWPLVDYLPENCKIWGERSDVDSFYSCMDLQLFPSKLEANPLVPKEALAWNMPILMYNLPFYKDSYSGIKDVTFLSGDVGEDSVKVLGLLNIDASLPEISEGVVESSYFNIIWAGGDGNRIEFLYTGNKEKTYNISIREQNSKIPLFYYQRLFEPNIHSWADPFTKDWCDLEKSKVKMLDIEFYELEDSTKPVFTKNLVVNVNSSGFNFNIHCPHDDPSFLNAWQFFDIDIYSEIDFEDKVVIDLGANIGLFTLYALSKGARKVYSVEPQSAPYAYLEKNFGNNEKVEIFNCGVLDKSFNSKIYRAIASSLGASIMPEVWGRYGDIDEDAQGEDVSILGFKDFIKNIDEKIDFLKIDTEGSEWKILNGLSKENLSRVRKVVMEFHPRSLDGVCNLKDIINYFGSEFKFSKHTLNEIFSILYFERI